MRVSSPFPLKLSTSSLRLLPRLPVSSIPPFIFPLITCFRRQFLRKMWPIQLAFCPVPGKIAFLSPCNSRVLSLLSVCYCECIGNSCNSKFSVLFLYQSAAYGSPKLLACILWGFGTESANNPHGREPAGRMAVNFSAPTHATCTICHSAWHKGRFQWTKSVQHCVEMQI